MKKILLAFDGHHFSLGAFEMALFLHQQEPVLVTGIFLSPVDYREMIGYSGMGLGAPVILPLIEPEDDAIKQNVKKFEDACIRQGMEFRVHRDTDLFALSELATETRYADLLILSSELFYENVDKRQPNEYLKKTLHHAECAVMLVPEHFTAPENLVLAYDGKESSVYAIKQFTYLFPQLSKLPALMVSFEVEKDALPAQQQIAELAARHYPQLSLEPQDLQANTFNTWLSEKKNVLLITGAFGRGELSLLFKRSFATEVIREHRVPLFIAHR